MMTWLDMTGFRKGALACVSTLALQLVVTGAAAGDAEDAYAAGAEAAAGGDHETACKRFAESAELDSNVRVLLALAECKQELGKWLDAREHLSAAVELLEDGPQREEANERIAVLTKRIPQLIVRLPHDAPEGATVSIDGRELDEGELGTAIELDPGEHRVAAKAPGEEAADVGVTLRPGDSIEVTAVLSPEDEPVIAPASPEPDPPAKKEGGWNPMPLGIALTVIGGTSLIATAITGGMYLRDRGIVEEECDEDNLCTERGLDAAERADLLGKVGTATAVAGGVLVGAGIAVMIGAAVSAGPDDDQPDRASMILPVVSPSELGLTWMGSF